MFCASDIELQKNFKKCCKQLPNANLRMMCLPNIKHIEREYYNYQNGAPISNEYTVQCSVKSKASSIAAMLETCDNPSTIEQIQQILSKKAGGKSQPKIQSRISSSTIKASSQSVVVSPVCCNTYQPSYSPVIDISSSNLNIQPFWLTITTKKIVREITVYNFETPKSGPKPGKFLVTLDLMNRNKTQRIFSPFTSLRQTFYRS